MHFSGVIGDSLAAAQLQPQLLAVAAANPDVLKDPPPAVRLMEFGDSGLGFELRVWSTTLIHRRGLLTSNLNNGIYRAFMEQGIKIPYPRRDVQILRGDENSNSAETPQV